MSISTRQASIKELAEIVGASIHGDSEVTISGIATLELAKNSDLSFFTNRKYHKYLLSTEASIVILHPDDVKHCPTNAILTDDPYLAYAKIATWLTKPENLKSQIAVSAIIAESATIGDNTSIEAHVVIGNNSLIGNNVHLSAGCVIGDNVKVGNDTVIYPNVSIYSNVAIGSNTTIHSGAVLGSDGFGIANEKGQWFKVPQLGTVIIGDNVEVGANTTIDRGAIEDTVIENGVKLDNLIQIAHNVRIGENTAIAGCVGIAGSTTIGKHCAIGGGSGILGHLTIADHVHITATSLVTKSIKESGVYSSGTPLQENAQWHKNFVRFKQLDKMARRLSKLEKKDD
ncbi:MAG: UDP-3-O-(3-hydroxymyristoyl)glucosamine N-acyltransferase [Gammaproteobacteria bacterium]|nr:UDP-3-O-(3-hydroxymyristoyl)glucosamine N-acyltransferase [Gammaproteobacteria bacterium]